MALLTFTTNFDKLRSKDPAVWKRQTIRWNADYWLKVANRKQKLHVWLGSPRTGKGKAEKLGIAEIVDFETSSGSLLNQRDAVLDGYESLTDLMDVLVKMHKVCFEEFYRHRWAIITFRFPDDPNG